MLFTFARLCVNDVIASSYKMPVGFLSGKVADRRGKYVPSGVIGIGGQLVRPIAAATQ
jgi:hypothetical protein